jgi:hypothetical protein
VTVILWTNGLPFFFLFLFFPLIPFLGRKRQVQRCPVCGWETDEVRVSFCPYDGSPLQVPDDRGRAAELSQ